MATPFETFITNELPKRTTLETYESTGYDGCPNDALAPDSLKNAPKGSYFLEATTKSVWRKTAAGSKTWTREMSDDITEEDFTVSVSTSGVDPSFALKIRNQADADAWGAFRTVGAAFRALPSFLKHAPTVLLEAGTWTITDDEWGELARFKPFWWVQLSGPDAWALAPGSPSSFAVSSNVGGQVVTLTAPHGLPADTYKDYYLHVVSGTGAGQFKPLRDYAVGGSTFTVVGSFSPVLNATSVVRIVERTASIDTGGLSSFIYGPGGSNSLIVLGLDKLNIIGDGGYLEPIDASLYLTGGTRFVGTGLYSFDSQIYYEDVIFDARNYVGTAVSIVGGGFRTTTSSSAALLDGGGVALPAIWVSDASAGGSCNRYANVTLFGRTIHFQGWDDCYVNVDGLGSSCTIWNYGLPSSDQLAPTAISCVNGGQFRTDSPSALAASTLKGATSDFRLDDYVEARWGMLDASLERSIGSDRGSRVSDVLTPGVEPPVATQEDFTIQLSSTGTDPTFTLRIVNQAQADAWGAFKTVAGAVAALPDILNHIVTVQFPPGLWDVVVDDGYVEGLDDLTRFRTSVSVAYGGLRFKGDPAWAQVAGTIDMDVQSCSGGIITLQAAHGLTPNTYETCYVYVSEGTGAGQFLPLSNYSGSQLGCVGSFSPILDSSSVVQIVDPATTLNISGADVLPSVRGGEYAVGTGRLYMGLERIKITPAGKGLGIFGGTWILRNCRLLMPIWGYSCYVGVYGDTFDLRSGAPFGEGAFYGQGAEFWVSSYSTEPVPSLFHGDGTTPALGQGNVTGKIGAISITGPNHFQNWGPSYIDSEGPGSRVYLHHGSNIYPTSDQLATTAVVLRQGAYAVVRTAAGFSTSSTFKGATYDFSLDGIIKTRWGVLDATVENGMQSPPGTAIVISEDTPTGIDTPNVTLEAITITMSPTGTDPTFNLLIVKQAQATAWGAFKTIKAALAALPDRLAYDVTLQFPTGTWDLSMQEFYDLQRIRVDANPNRRAAGDPWIRLILAGDNSWLQVPGTPASMAVQSQVGETITLQSDPGLPDDERAGYYLVVLSGTGAGQYKPIRYHSGASFQVAQAYSPSLNATSVVQIATRPTIFNLIDQDDVATDYGYLMLDPGKGDPSYAAPTVEFRRIEFITPRVFRSNLRFAHASGYLSEGTRLLDKVTLEIYADSVVTFGDVIFLAETASSNYGLLYISGAGCNTYERYGTVVFFCNRSPGITRAIWGTGAGQRYIMLFQCDVVFQGFTDSYLHLRDPGYNTLHNGVGALNYKSDGQADVAVTLIDGAKIVHHLTNFSDLLTSSFRGTIADVLIDDEYVTWEEADLEPNNLVIGARGSMLMFREYY